MEPVYNGIRGTMLNEPYMQCDEFAWPVPSAESGLNGYARGAWGRESRLAEVPKYRAVDTERISAKLQGCGGEDSYTG